MAREEIYLEFVKKENDYGFSIESAVVLFVLKFMANEKIDQLPFRIVLVATDDLLISVVTCNLNGLNNATKCEHAELPDDIARCQLPAFANHNGLLIHCGLTSSLRSLIQELAKVYSTENYIEILVYVLLCFL